MDVCVYICMYVCVYVSMYVCIYVCMYVRTHVCMYGKRKEENWSIEKTGHYSNKWVNNFNQYMARLFHLNLVSFCYIVFRYFEYNTAYFNNYGIYYLNK